MTVDQLLLEYAPAAHQTSIGCRHTLLHWEVWDESLGDGIWRNAGSCGRPATTTVLLNCADCGLDTAANWCRECTTAYRHEVQCAGGGLVCCERCHAPTMRFTPR